MYKLLIAESSEPYADSLVDAFQDDFQLRLCCTGVETLKALEEFQPDVLLIDLGLAQTDGLTVLQETTFRPGLICAISPLVNAYVEQRAFALGVHYLTILPAVRALRIRLLDLVATTIAPKEDMRVQTAMLLHTLSFQPHLDGYQQLCIGIPIYARNPGVPLSKDMYPKVAEELKLTDVRTVEHSIRKAITAAWSRMNPAIWAQYFPLDKDGIPLCPSNKEFVSRVCQLLEMPK